MGLKELFLNKGWAGRTLSRPETAERINPLIRRHHELNRSYDFAIAHLDDRGASERLSELQRIGRADVGKLSETVLSAGEVSYNGTDLEPEQFDLGSDDGAILRELTRREEEFIGLLEDESLLEHQIRTRAIVAIVLKDSRERLDTLRGFSRGAR